MKTKPDLEIARKIIIAQVAKKRTGLIDLLQSGFREYDELRALLEDYIGLQHAADVLGERQ